MATGLAPGFSYSGRKRMTYGQVKNLARAFGLPGDAFAQIAKGESGLKADIQQRDPGDGMVGYGLLQMTPNAWGAGSPARRYMEKLGGIKAMNDPVKNMAMARFLYRSAGNKLTPWHGTRFLTNRSGEGKLGPIDRSRVPSVFGSTSGASLGGGTTTSSGGTTTPLDQGSQQSLLPLLQALTQQSSGPPAASIQAPSFTAHPVLPEGFGTVSGGGPVQQGPDIGTLAAAVKTLGGNVPAAGQSTDTPSTASPTMDVSGNHPGLAGRVKFNPNADRPGVRTQAITKDFLARVAGFSHREITVGTGTNHNRMTTSGNVSDHWTGHAADIPQAIDSKLGDLTAAHALEAAGVPWSQAYAMARKGGVFNVTPKSGPFKGHRVQVLWKTMVGGNHHNHVHVGIR